MNPYSLQPPTSKATSSRVTQQYDTIAANSLILILPSSRSVTTNSNTDRSSPTLLHHGDDASLPSGISRHPVLHPSLSLCLRPTVKHCPQPPDSIAPPWRNTTNFSKQRRTLRHRPVRRCRQHSTLRRIGIRTRRRLQTRLDSSMRWTRVGKRLLVGH